MLSEDAIDNLIQPMIDRQEALNVYALQMIASRLKEVGSLQPSDVKKIKILMNMGTDVRKFNKELSRVSGLQEKEIKHIIKTVAKDNYVDAKPMYDYRHKSYVPFKDNDKLQKIVRAVEKETVGTYRNLSNSRAIGFVYKSPKTKTYKFDSVEKTYQRVIDEAIQSIVSGLVDPRVAIRRALKELSDSGIQRLYWESGYHQRLDTAVRRNILDGVKAINQRVQDEIGEQINADGKEISVHEYSAPDHEPFQGHQFKNEEWEKLQSNADFRDVAGKRFKAVRRIIGQWNCRHFARSIIVGVTKPKYTNRQLGQFKARNTRGYTFPNGKHLTMYQCTQMQRQLETKIRYAKEEQMTMKTAGLKDGQIAARLKVIKLTEEYKQFSKACGLPPHMDRCAVSGYQMVV